MYATELEKRRKSAQKKGKNITTSFDIDYPVIAAARRAYDGKDLIDMPENLYRAFNGLNWVYNHGYGQSKTADVCISQMHNTTTMIDKSDAYKKLLLASV